MHLTVKGRGSGSVALLVVCVGDEQGIQWDVADWQMYNINEFT